MRLSTSQKKDVIKWLTAGLNGTDIRRLAAEQEPPFDVSDQQLAYYRRTREISDHVMRHLNSDEAMTTGLALRSERVLVLRRLAARLLADLVDGDLIWLEQERSIRTADGYRVIVEETFNSAELNALRDVLADIAAELGHRKTELGLTIGKRDGDDDSILDEALSIIDALRERDDRQSGRDS